MNDIDSLLDLVAHGLGVAIVPRPVQGRYPRVRFIPIRAKALVWEVALVSAENRPLGAAAQVLLEMIEAQVKQRQ